MTRLDMKKVGALLSVILLIGGVSVFAVIGVIDGPTSTSTTVAGTNTFTSTTITSIPGGTTTITQQNTEVHLTIYKNTTSTVTSTIVGGGSTVTQTITTTISSTTTLQCPGDPLC